MKKQNTKLVIALLVLALAGAFLYLTNLKANEVINNSETSETLDEPKDAEPTGDSKDSIAPANNTQSPSAPTSSPTTTQNQAGDSSSQPFVASASSCAKTSRPYFIPGGNTCQSKTEYDAIMSLRKVPVVQPTPEPENTIEIPTDY